jgi:hypothetical protein
MYIESHQSLRNHPKVKKAARLAGINEFEMIGRLHCLWWWAIDYAPDGDVTKYSKEDIEAAVDWNGDPGKLYDALIECGFNGHCGLLEDVDGLIVIHDWQMYGGKIIGRRETDAERKRNIRRTSAGHPQDGEQTAHVDKIRQDKIIEDKTREDNNTSANPTSVELTDLQKMVLVTFNAKRFRNQTQAALVLAWDRYPQDNVKAACTWAATKGFGLGQAIASIEKALPKWNATRTNGNGNGSTAEPSSPMLRAIARRQGIIK